MDLPDRFARLSGGANRLVWTNDLGGRTWALGDPVHSYLKVAPIHPELDLLGEAERLRWAAGRIPVPEVLDAGADADGSWLLTRALPGTPATAFASIEMVGELGRALRVLHDSLPVEDCPFQWSTAIRLRQLGHDPARSPLGPEPDLDPVVCHGDPEAPNLLLTDGRCSGWVDLGSAGVADRWADLAVAIDSLGVDVPDLDPTITRDALLDGYGIALDQDSFDFHLALWQLDAAEDAR